MFDVSAFTARIKEHFSNIIERLEENKKVR